jgi:hypothetical protein
VQRKAYVPGIAALLVALLAGCTGSGSTDEGGTDNSNPGAAGTATAAAQPGKYRTLPEPCGAVGHDTLDSLLPGIRQMTDEQQRNEAYQGEATATFDTDRKVGCRWKVGAADATDRLLVDFERVVSYDNSVSDDSEAQELFATKQAAADLPESASSRSGSASGSPSATPAESASDSGAVSGSASGSASPSATPSGLPPRTLSGLGDEAFLDDAVSGSGSTVEQRTVTVAFRTSNVIVTIVYEEQPATVGAVPDSKEMQDRAQKLAAELADALAA